MNLALPYGRAKQPTYQEGSGLRSVRDADSNSQLWKKARNVTWQDNSGGQVIERMRRQIQALRRAKNIVLPPAPQIEPFYPFKIYQPTNLAAFVGQTVQTMLGTLATGAPLQTCKIVDANAATNLSASTPQISISDTWRFWAVRDGYFELRSNYATSNPTASTINNFANEIIPNNTDAAYNNQIPFDADVTTTFNPPLVIGVNLAPGTEGGEQAYAVIWLEAIQDTSAAVAPSVTLRGYAGSGEPSTVFEIYNNGDVAVGTILIGALSPAPNPNYANNYIFDHARNRYPCGNGNWPASSGNGTSFNIRGTFQYGGSAPDNVTAPADLATQLFYPGDAIPVSDPSNLYGGSGFIHPWQALYVFTGATPAKFGVPALGPFNDANWTQLMPSPIAT